MIHDLVPVVTAADWQAMHEIRRATLFSRERHPDVAYDENHVDDRLPDNQPYLLAWNGARIGVVRLDARGRGEGVVRLVAIVLHLQRQGHGRALGRSVDREARRRGMERLLVNAAPAAVGFYLRTGWQEEVWDRAELFGIAAHCVQMAKSLSLTDSDV